ncbi:MAG TPA: prepilin-type N-terminal cleavage/methylation domain-containing protein [Pyrinomonadaceae bacterium]|nr:prepilin-type N-terminal cleavage/methylation domain-containing protein [Pyrinomonadaceae bacterium]
MIGKRQFSVLSFQFSGEHEKAVGNAPMVRRLTLKTENSKLKTGFTLLELMIVISIIVILAVIIMPQYQRTITHARETVLKDDLFQLRKVIDMYWADKGKPAQSPEDLVSAGYLHEIPVDPITSERDWQWATGEDPGSAEGGQGIVNVHSASPDQSTEGTPYSEW